MKNNFTEKNFEPEATRSFDKKAELIKTIGKGIMLLVVCAGIAGVFGFGGWTKKELHLGETCKVEYEYFLHKKRETPLRFFVGKHVQDSLFVITLSSDYMKKVNIKSIFPKPVEMILGEGTVNFKFKSLGAFSGFIDFNSYPVEAGSLNFVISVDGKEKTIHQFIYP